MVVVYWLVETYVDTLVGMGTYASRLLPYGDINELWMRGIIIFLIVLFTRYARASVARQKRLEFKLRQALTNLLDNAITYTPEGGTIRLSAHAARGRAVLAVRDTGPGIDAQHLPHLCEPFYRVDSTRSGGSNHAGLGLALAAWIAQAHGGHLAVESRIGLGSVFTLSLPLRELASLA